MENSKQLTLRELQLEELEILKEVTKYIDSKGLKYFFVGGTLLGAIRHNGFIPWDDDIDIAMPRKDYEAFLNSIKKESLSEGYEIFTMENKKHNRPFCKVVNKNINIETKSQEDKYLWIDIFPIDGLPEDEKKSQKVIKKILYYKGQIYLKTTSIKEILSERKSLFNRVLKILLKPITYRHKTMYYAKKMDKIAKKNDYENSRMVAELSWIDGYHSVLYKDFFSSSVKHEFEDEFFNIPIGWDSYLKKQDGDYMKLPPEESRVDHKIIANRIEK